VTTRPPAAPDPGAAGTAAAPPAAPAARPGRGTAAASGPGGRLPDAVRRRVGVLVVSQVLGGVGVASGIAVGGLLAQQVSGSTSLSGLAQTMGVLGAALLAVPMAALARRRGRGPALATGYGFGLVGGALAVAAAVTDQFLLLLLAITLFGGGTAAGLQARYAATDGAPVHVRGRLLSVVVWATTIGSVVGPNLSSVGGDLGRGLGIPELAGPYLFSCTAFALAGAVVLLLLRRPDDDPGAAGAGAGADGGHPVAPVARTGTADALRLVARLPAARAGLVAVAGGQALMVAVMVMTPVHLGDHGASLRVVGFVLSLHIAGMYALSPVVGWATDRFGAIPVIGAGVVVLAAAAATGASAGPMAHSQVAVALTLLGLGWSCTMVAGSSLLSASVPAEVRTQVQGAGDLVVGVTAAAAGALAGPVLELAGYSWLNVAALVVLVPVVAAAVVARRSPQPETQKHSG
jgi:MFS family permease